MTQAKHTEGPWQIIGDDEYADGCPCIDVSNSRSTSSVAYVVADVDDGITEEDRANACLIAAAPEMLEELRATREVLIELRDNHIYGTSWLTLVQPRIDSADAAIAKATAPESTAA